MYEINHRELNELIKRHYAVRESMFVFGTVGIGKSEGVKAAAQEIALELKREYVEWTKLTELEKQNLLAPDQVKKVFIFADLRISQLEPSDLQIPDIKSDADYLQRKYDLLFKVCSTPETKGIIFFDELNLAPPSLQASLYQIINDNEFGDLKLSDGIFRIGAGNTEEDQTNVFEMGSALVDRFSIFKLMPADVEEWEDWAVDNDINTSIISFLHYKPGSLHKRISDVNADIVQPTHRSWFKVSKLIDGITDYDLIERLAAGRVGEGVAVEFTAYMRLSEQIDIQAILKNPAKSKLPAIDRTDMLYSLISGIVDIYKKKKSKPTLNSILVISTRLSPEFGVLLLRLTKRVDKNYFMHVRNMKQFDKMHNMYGKYLLDTK